MKKGLISSASRHGLLTCFALSMILPMIYTVCNSFMSVAEVEQYYGSVFSDKGSAVFHLFPDILSLDTYYRVFLAQPDYLVKFITSLLLVGVIIFGQAAVSVFAGYALAKYPFPGSNVCFFVVIILTMMPYQVTLVSNYIVLDYLGLINTYWALILPGIFSPFGVFLMRQVMLSVPNEMIEAAELDGANILQTIFHIVVPYCKSGIVALLLLSFFDNWNMVEQPLVFLEDSFQYPLSVYLAQFNSDHIGLSFTCGVLAMLPAVLLFFFFEDDLCNGVAFANLK